MANPRRNSPAVSETRDLQFQYRALLSARQILDEKLDAATRGRSQSRFHAQHIRRLRLYLGKAIFEVEEQLREREIDPREAAASSPPPVAA